jgi:hypothetical protein
LGRGGSLVPARAGSFIPPASHGPLDEGLVGASDNVTDGVPEEFFCFLFVCAPYPLFPCVEGRVYGGSDSVHQHLEYEVRAEGCAACEMFCGNSSILWRCPMEYAMFPSFEGDECVFGKSAGGDQASTNACRVLLFAAPIPPVCEGGAHVGGMSLFLFVIPDLFSVVPGQLALGTGW